MLIQWVNDDKASIAALIEALKRMILERIVSEVESTIYCNLGLTMNNCFCQKLFRQFYIKLIIMLQNITRNEIPNTTGPPSTPTFLSLCAAF